MHINTFIIALIVSGIVCFFGIIVALLELSFGPLSMHFARKYNSNQLEKIREFYPIISIIVSSIFLAICIATIVYSENTFIVNIASGAFIFGLPIIVIFPILFGGIIDKSLKFKNINEILNYLNQNNAIYLKLKEQKPSDLFSRVSKPIFEKLHWKLILVNKINKKVALIVTNDSNEIIYREDFCFDQDSLDFIKDNFDLSI